MLAISGCQPPASAGTGQQAFSQFLIETVTFVLMAAFIYYWLVTRPMEMKELKHEKFLKEVKKGDQVVLKSGIIAKLQSSSEDFITVEIAPNVKVKVEATAVQAYDPEKYKKKDSGKEDAGKKDAGKQDAGVSSARKKDKKK